MFAQKKVPEFLIFWGVMHKTSTYVKQETYRSGYASYALSLIEIFYEFFDVGFHNGFLGC